MERAGGQIDVGEAGRIVAAERLANAARAPDQPTEHGVLGSVSPD